MIRPLIGVSCDATSMREQPAQAVIERYYTAVRDEVGACVVLIPETTSASDLRTLLSRLDGVLLTGSTSNVAPVRYGEEGLSEPSDELRDRTTLPLLDAARDRNIPVLGICRGMQEINVAFGGTLRRDLDERADSVRHHAATPCALDILFGTEHDVRLEPAGVLAAAIGRTEMRVNSVHHQGVGRLADGLAAEARSADGLIEAVRAYDAPILGVQWHPEWKPRRNDHAPKIFGLFGACVRGASLQEAARSVAGEPAS